jgi:hypothetical protein
VMTTRDNHSFWRKMPRDSPTATDGKWQEQGSIAW